MNPSEVLKEWNSTQSRVYRLSEADLRWNHEQQNLVVYRVVRIGGVPCITSIASKDGAATGIPAKNLWLNLWGDIEEGKEAAFVAALEDHVTQAGYSKLVIGGDEFHCVPGVPMESKRGQGLKAALAQASFSGAEAADFAGRLDSNEVDTYVSDALMKAEERGLSFTKVISVATQDQLEMFLDKEFPGRWAREFRFWRSREDTRRAVWMTLRDQTDGVIGFARIAVRGRHLPLDKGWTPGALRLPLDSKDLLITGSDSCLGPIGVAVSERGKGTGKVLLGLVLETLRHKNAERVCIDWTNAFKYYEPLGFEIARRYWTAWKSIPSS
ncbi:MAG TPA: GNAT family N-acetyltransferase [Bdellovibrionales bacterium]|nr:GNAT family N-acetyltransferase [Bdellovibrionales bacterium]